MSCTFLDLDIIVENNRFITRLYDKRRDFSFKVVSLPYMKSNIPTALSSDLWNIYWGII